MFQRLDLAAWQPSSGVGSYRKSTHGSDGDWDLNFKKRTPQIETKPRM